MEEDCEELSICAVENLEVRDKSVVCRLVDKGMVDFEPVPRKVQQRRGEYAAAEYSGLLRRQRIPSHYSARCNRGEASMQPQNSAALHRLLRRQ